VIFLPLKIAMKIVSLLVTAAVAYLVLSAIQVVLASRTSTDLSTFHRADAVAVDGTVGTGATLGSDLTARLTTAAAVVKSGLAPRVVGVLNTPPGSDPAATAQAAAILTQNGLSPGQYQITSTAGGTSWLQIVASHIGGSKPPVIVVTDAIDALWTKGAATGAGMTPQIDPAAGSKVFLWKEFGSLVRETTGVAAGRIIGDGRASWAAA